MGLDYERLYLLEENHRRTAAFRASSVDLWSIKDEHALLRGEELPESPVGFKHHQGRHLNDVVWTTLVQAILVSERLIEVLRDNGFTGWGTYPIELYDKRGERIDGYHGLSITGRCRPIDLKRSRKAWRGPLVPRGEKFQVYCGMFFKDDYWDGSDIFLPAPATFKIVGEQLKHALDRLKIRSIAFSRLSTLELDCDIF